MSRREYDYTYEKEELPKLIKAINEQKSNYGGSDMYIELARKFDNTDYQWVCYRNTASSNTDGDTTTSGYFVLFDKDGNVIKSISFSFPYLCHGLTQCALKGQSNSQAYFQHIFLAIYRGNTVRTNYLDVYWISVQVVLATGVKTWSDIKLHNTGKDVKNFVTSNVYAASNNNGTNNGVKVYFFGNSNQTRQCAFGYTEKLGSVTSLSPSISPSGNRKESSSQRIGCQQIYNDENNYYWATWDPDNAINTMSWTATKAYTGWNRSTTTLAPYVNNYNNCYIFPIWSWNINTKTTPDITYLQKSIWWQSPNGYLERKYLLSDYTTGAVNSSTGTEQSYRIPANTTYSAASWGLYTEDGVTIYTLNIETKLLEKINTTVA